VSAGKEAPPPKDPESSEDEIDPNDLDPARLTRSNLKRLLLRLDKFKARATRATEALQRMTELYESLRRSYYLAGLGKKIDISTLPQFSTIARQVMADERIGMHYDRLYALWQAVTSSPDGYAVAEVGSYKGGSSKFIAESLRAMGRAPRFYVCDTFAGHARLDAAVDGVSTDSGFKDTTAESVREYLVDYPNVQVIEGDIFDTSAQLATEPGFAFVHIDVDVYPPTQFCLQFFSSRLAPGGLIVVDDYGVVTCPGAQKAVDEFIHANPRFHRLHLLSGQAVLFRAG
jgi:O-methyltransferase